jgi:signal peptidase II
MVIAVIVSIFIIIYNTKLPANHYLYRVALGLMLGGALGNFIDRVRQGHVTDFMDIGPWPVWNVSDLCIVTGVILLMFLMFMEQRREAAAAKVNNERLAEEQQQTEPGRGS